MAKFFSAFIEDTPANDHQHHNHPRELDILSGVPIEKLVQTPQDKINVLRCEPGGCEIHAPLGKNADDAAITQLLFTVPARDTDYPIEARFAPFTRTPTMPNAYQSLTQRGGHSSRHDRLEFSANGNEVTMRRTYGANEPCLHHYHRVPSNEPAALSLAA